MVLYIISDFESQEDFSEHSSNRSTHPLITIMHVCINVDFHNFESTLIFFPQIRRFTKTFIAPSLKVLHLILYTKSTLKQIAFQSRLLTISAHPLVNLASLVAATRTCPTRANSQPSHNTSRVTYRYFHL